VVLVLLSSDGGDAAVIRSVSAGGQECCGDDADGKSGGDLAIGGHVCIVGHQREGPVKRA